MLDTVLMHSIKVNRN